MRLLSLFQLQTLGVGLAAGLAGTLACRFFALRWGIVDRPNPIVPQHRAPVAYLGGLGLGLGALAAWSFWVLRTDAAVAGPVRGLWVGALLFLALGLLDDLKRLAPAPKLALQGLAAAGAMAAGTRLDLTGQPLLDLALSWFWIVTAVNAFNFTDVCDGLVSGLGVVALSGAALVVPEGLAPYALGAAGAACGVLALNRPPASIFLGDAGSHLVGFLVAAFGLAVTSRGEGALAWAPAVLLAAVPLFELVFITLVRVSKGLPWWRGSSDHFALRLQKAGLSRWSVDLLAWAASAGAVALAVRLPALAPQARMGALLLALALAAGTARLLLRWEVEG